MAELLTQLQDQLDTLSRKFYECVGILQRDAPPVPVSGEQLVAKVPAAGFNLQDTVQRMAVEIREQVQVTEQLIQLLPDGMGVMKQDQAVAQQAVGQQTLLNPPEAHQNPPEAHQNPPEAHVGDSACLKGFEQEVLELQQQHQHVAMELAAAAAEAEDVLLQLQELHAALACIKLRARRTQQPDL